MPGACNASIPVHEAWCELDRCPHLTAAVPCVVSAVCMTTILTPLLRWQVAGNTLVFE